MWWFLMIWCLYLVKLWLLCDNIMWQHYVTTLCDNIMWQHYVTTLCDNIMWQHYVTTLCDNIMWQHYVTKDTKLLRHWKCKDMGCPCSTWLPFDVYISCILCTYLLPMLLCLLFVCIKLFIYDYDLLYLYL